MGCSQDTNLHLISTQYCQQNKIIHTHTHIYIYPKFTCIYICSTYFSSTYYLHILPSRVFEYPAHSHIVGKWQSWGKAGAGGVTFSALGACTFPPLPPPTLNNIHV